MFVTRNAAIAALAAAAISAVITMYVRPEPAAAVPAHQAPATNDGNAQARRPSNALALSLDNDRPQYASTAGPRRNLFAFDDPPPAPVRAPRAVAPAVVAAPQPRVEVVAQPPQPQAPQPPEIPFRCIGAFGPANAPMVALVRDGEVVNVHAGDVIDGKFIVRSIGIESVEIGFTGFPREADRRIAIGH